MAKAPKWRNTGAAGLAKQELDQEQVYEGEVPTKRGVYPVKLRLLRLVTNSSDDPMFKTMTVIAAPKGHKFREYNGYPVWGNWNLTDASSKWCNAMLAALGLDEKQRAKVWASSSAVKLDDNGNVVSLAGKKIKQDIPLRALCEYDGEYDALKASSFLTGEAATTAEDDEDDEEGLDEFVDDDDDDDDDDSDDDDDDDDDDDSDDDDDDDDDSDDDDDDDEPEPPKSSKRSSSKKSTPAKKSSAKTGKAATTKKPAGGKGRKKPAF